MSIHNLRMNKPGKPKTKSALFSAIGIIAAVILLLLIITSNKKHDPKSGLNNTIPAGVTYNAHNIYDFLSNPDCFEIKDNKIISFNTRELPTSIGDDKVIWLINDRTLTAIIKTDNYCASMSYQLHKKNKSIKTVEHFDNIQTFTYNNDILRSIDGYFNASVSNADEGLIFLTTQSQILNKYNSEFSFIGSTKTNYHTQYSYIQTIDNNPVLNNISTVLVDQNNNVVSLSVKTNKINSILSNRIDLEEAEAMLSDKYNCEISLNNVEDCIIKSNDAWSRAIQATAVNLQYRIHDRFVIDMYSSEILTKQATSMLATSQSQNIYIVDGRLWVEQYYLPEDYELMIQNDTSLNNVFAVSDKAINVSNIKNDNDKKIANNFIRVADWYQNILGRKSFDGNGSPITIVMSSNAMMLDNASYFGEELDIFVIGKVNNALNQVGSKLDIAAHEYTHGVFTTATMSELYLRPNNIEIMAIQEAYADIFSCLIDNNWRIGDGCFEIGRPIRDISKSTLTYDQARWDHINVYTVYTNSMILSNTAYQMYKKGFSEQEISELWYLSMLLGFDENANFSTVRNNINRSLKLLGFAHDDIITVNNIFDNLKIPTVYTEDIRHQ